MGRLPTIWTPHKVTVQPFLGESANGPLHDAPLVVGDVYVKDQQETVTDPAGSEVVSRATVRFNLEDLPPIGSKVTVWAGTAEEYEAVMFKTSRLAHPSWPSIGVGWLK